MSSDAHTAIASDSVRRFGSTVDFGKTAADYARHRAGFPPRFFAELARRGLSEAGQAALDLGTGTGSVARGLALAGMQVAGLDPAPALLERARALDAEAGVSVDYHVGRAEDAGAFPAESFSLIVAGQCWHWFRRNEAAANALRWLAPGGVLAIAHFDWLPLRGSVVAATEALILEHNPAWRMAGGTGFYPAWAADLYEAGFRGLESFSFDVEVEYPHEAWRGRIRASAGVAASLAPDAVAAFDAAHDERLKRDFPAQPLRVPHRCWAVWGRNL